MRVRNLAALVAISMCLTTAAWGSTWTGSSGLLWNNDDNWDPVGVPDGVDAIIGNAGVAALESVVPDIDNLAVTLFSTLNILDGAGLTASGNANVGSAGFDEGYVNQDGGVVSFGSALTLAGNTGDFGRWRMTSDGSLAVATDLTVGGSGAAEFELRDTSSLTVGGRIDIGQAGGNGATMTVAGGTLGQLAGGGDPAILADLTVSDGGTFAVRGSAATINVETYEQVTTGALNLVLDNGGIAPINIDGHMTLAGELNVSFASGAALPPGTYDILIAGGGRTGKFGTENLPDGVAVRYDVVDGNYVASLYVDVEPPPPANAGETISINTSWVADVAKMETELVSADLVGAPGVEAVNWNNVDVSAGTSLPHHHEPVIKAVDVPNLIAESGGATLVRMKLDGRQPCQPSLPFSYDQHPTAIPEQNGGPTSPDHAMMHSGPASRIDSGVIPGFFDYMQLELNGLADQFPNGYDVILYFGNGGHFGTGETGYTVVTGPGTFAVGTGGGDPADTEVTPFGTHGVQSVMPPIGPNIAGTHGWSGMHNHPDPNENDYNYKGEYVLSTDTSTAGNYQIISGQAMDTLTLTFVPENSNINQSNVFTLLGVQVVATTSPLQPMEFIVDNLDFADYWSWSAGIKTNSVIDGWREYPTGPDAWYGREGTWAQWDAPSLPFEEPTEYEVFTWVAATSPGDILRERDPIALYTIKHAEGETVFEFDQNTAPGTWVSLGKYLFTNDGLEYVRIDSQAPDGAPVTSYDAVRWLWTPPPQVQAIPEPTGLGLIGLALLTIRRRRS